MVFSHAGFGGCCCFSSPQGYPPRDLSTLLATTRERERIGFLTRSLVTSGGGTGSALVRDLRRLDKQGCAHTRGTATSLATFYLVRVASRLTCYKITRVMLRVKNAGSVNSSCLCNCVAQHEKLMTGKYNRTRLKFR